MGHLLTAGKLHVRTTVAQVIICLGLFIGVSYQACNKYRCHGDDYSGGRRASQVTDRGRHVLWVAAGSAGLAMLCGASLLLEAHFHDHRNNKKRRVSWWDDVITTACMATVAFLAVTLLFWIDLIPGFGESRDLEEVRVAMLKSISRLFSDNKHHYYQRACIVISATYLASTLLVVRLLSAGRPTFQLATLATLGVLVSELWWSVSRIDGTGSWQLQVRMTGEAAMAVIGGLLMVGGLAAWLTFRQKTDSPTEVAVREFDVLQVREFDVFQVRQTDIIGGATKYAWPLQNIAACE